MAGFTTYPILTNRYRKELKKEAKIVCTKPGQEAQEILKRMPYFNNTMDFMIMLEEHWMLHNGELLFPDSVELLDQLARSKVDARVTDFLEDSSYLISFPSQYKINGLPITSCMLTIATTQQSANDIQREFLDKVDPKLEVMSDWDGFLSLVYSLGDGYQRLSVPISTIEMMFSPDFNWDLSIQTLDNIGTEALNEVEQQYQRVLLRLVMSLLVYRQACPNQCVDGVPHKKAVSQLMQGKKSSMMSAVPSPTGGPLGPVTVGWTFRQLRDERYYKGEYAHLKRGSRVVFVAPHTRGWKNDTTTVTKE